MANGLSLLNDSFVTVFILMNILDIYNWFFYTYMWKILLHSGDLLVVKEFFYII